MIYHSFNVHQYAEYLDSIKKLRQFTVAEMVIEKQCLSLAKMLMAKNNDKYFWFLYRYHGEHVDVNIQNVQQSKLACGIL